METRLRLADYRDHRVVIRLPGLERTVQAENCPRAFYRPAVREEPIFFEDRAFLGRGALLIERGPRGSSDGLADARQGFERKPLGP